MVGKYEQKLYWRVSSVVPNLIRCIPTMIADAENLSRGETQ